MRIGGGTLRGRSLRVASGTRPTPGRARGALFDIWGQRLARARLLDLFAGSGAVGIEAMSRGAASVVAVESSRNAVAVLHHNYGQLLPDAAWRIVPGSLPEVLEKDVVTRSAPFDLVFADPPYVFEEWIPLLIRVAPLVAHGGEAAIEHGRRNRPPATVEGLERSALRSYGETELSFYAG